MTLESDPIDSAMPQYALMAFLCLLPTALFALNAEAAQEQRREVVFIEGNVADVPTLVSAVQPGREVHVLDAARNGLAQMAEILRGRNGVDAIHLLSHGSPGALDLGALILKRNNLPDHAADLAVIAGALNSDADILLYGCNVAQGTDGAAFVSALAQGAHATIAASTNPTGAASKGGDWTLEYAPRKLHTAVLSGAAYSEILGTTATYDFNAGLSDIPATSITSAPTSGTAAAGETLLVSSVQTILGSLTGITGVVGYVIFGADSLLADYGNSGTSGIDTVTFKLSSGNQFDLTSFKFSDPSGNSDSPANNTATIKAYVGATLGCRNIAL